MQSICKTILAAAIIPALLPLGLAAAPQQGDPHGLSSVAGGKFESADADHRATGTFSIVAAPNGQMRLSLEGFEVTEGPDLHLRLSAHPNPLTGADVLAMPYKSLGPLKSFSGRQAYRIFADIEVSDYETLVIWCERYSVLFGRAEIVAAGNGQDSKSQRSDNKSDR